MNRCILGACAWLMMIPWTCFGQSAIDPETRLLGVSHPELAQAVESLAGHAVHVHPLTHWSEDATGYERMNERAVDFRGAAAFVFKAYEEESTDRLWRERFANHGVRTIGLPRHRDRVGSTPAEDLLRGMHAALVELLPEHRTQLDENLRMELERLQQRSGRSWWVVNGAEGKRSW